MAMNPRLMRPLAKTPPGTPASLLLRFNGADASTDFVDSSPNKLTVTASGDAQISTAQSKFGGASGAFGGAGYVSTASASALGLGTGDFTVEWWARATNVTNHRSMMNLNTYADGLFVRGIGPDNFYVAGTYATWDADNLLPLNEWTHFAIVRFAGLATLYVNGVAAASIGGTPGAADLGSSASVLLGASAHNTSGEVFAGYIDDFRIVPGLAVYTGPFIPPTQQLSAYATPAAIQREASLLLHFNGDDESTVFTDSSVNALTVTANGDAQLSTAESKFGGSSGYFDGNGDLLSAPYSSDFDFGTGDFTIEWWSRPTAINSDECVVAAGGFPNGWAAYVAGDGGSSGLSFAANIGYWFGFPLGASPVSANQWYHFAIVRRGGTLKGYIDGTLVGTSASFSGNITAGGGGLTVGSDHSCCAYDGYIDDLRITPGLAVYTGPFTPPTQQLSATATVAPVLPFFDYLLVAGGGGGGSGGDNASGGGGGGGTLEGTMLVSIGTAYSVSIGAGGAADSSGGDTTLDSFTAIGGGYGGGTGAGGNGGCGGGGGSDSATQAQNAGGVGSQGFDGGFGQHVPGMWEGGGGGGGGGAVGTNGDAYAPANVNGGDGLSSSITGSAVSYAGGGGGGACCDNPGAGGAGGGGQGGDDSVYDGANGSANTGGGGGGTRVGYATPGSGGSGVVILSFDSALSPTIGAGLVYSTASNGGNTVLTITGGSDTITF